MEILTFQYSDDEDEEQEISLNTSEKEDLMSEVADILNNHDHKPSETSESETCQTINDSSENKVEESGINPIKIEDAKGQDVEEELKKEENDTEIQEITPKVIKEAKIVKHNGITSTIEALKVQGGEIVEEQEIQQSFWCDICEKDLNTEGAWMVHNKFAHPNRVLTVTSGQKPEPKEASKPQKFWCETCEKELNSVATWNVHNKFAHGIEPPNNDLIGSKSSGDNKNDDKGRMRKSSFMISFPSQG